MPSIAPGGGPLKGGGPPGAAMIPCAKVHQKVAQRVFSSMDIPLSIPSADPCRCHNETVDAVCIGRMTM
jgi:hypothetical protein